MQCSAMQSNVCLSITVLLKQLLTILSFVLLFRSLPGVDKAKMLQLAPGGSDPCPSNYLDNYAIPSEKFWGW